MTKYQSDALIRIFQKVRPVDGATSALKMVEVFCESPGRVLTATSLSAMAQPSAMAAVFLMMAVVDTVCTDPEGKHEALVEKAIKLLTKESELN